MFKKLWLQMLIYYRGSIETIQKSEKKTPPSFIFHIKINSEWTKTPRVKWDLNISVNSVRPKECTVSSKKPFHVNTCLVNKCFLKDFLENLTILWA